MNYYQSPPQPMISDVRCAPALRGDPCRESIDRACLVDGYTVSPDWTVDSFFESDSFFDRPISSVESPANLTPPIWPLFDASNPANLNAWSPSPQRLPFGHIDNLNFHDGSRGNGVFHHVVPSSVSSSSTPEIRGDAPPMEEPPPSPTSPRSLKRESPDFVETNEPAQKRPQRKRGRPRLDRSTSAVTACNSASKQTKVQRLPHNQVERKYREGLNAELERLRRAVPTLVQHNPTDVTEPPKPSKATILASAIDYIKRVEAERDALRNENEKLRGMRPSMAKPR